jgi:hypothetical protein
MAQSVLTQMLEEIVLLDLEELRRLQQAIEERLSEGGYTPEEERAHQALLAAGLVTEIKPRFGGSGVERPLVPIQGKPLSETILEERR